MEAFGHRLRAARGCSGDLRAKATMRGEPDGTAAQAEARRHFQPAPDWAALDEEPAFGSWRLVDGRWEPKGAGPAAPAFWRSASSVADSAGALVL